MFVRYSVATILVAMLAGCSKPAPLPAQRVEVATSTAEVAASSVSEIAAGYKSFQQITEGEVYVNPLLAFSCVSASMEQMEVERLRHGPHANTSILIYMNELAAAAFAKGATPYPVGAVIVKHKNIGGHNDKEGKRIVPENDGVGGMVKRAPGYDPTHGDWEYFYFEDAAKIESGPIASCVKCHASAKATDYVFGTWRSPRD